MRLSDKPGHWELIAFTILLSAVGVSFLVWIVWPVWVLFIALAVKQAHLWGMLP